MVGLLRGAQLNASPTAYMTQDLYGEIVRATNPNVPFIAGQHGRRRHER